MKGEFCADGRSGGIDQERPSVHFQLPWNDSQRVVPGYKLKQQTGAGGDEEEN